MPIKAACNEASEGTPRFIDPRQTAGEVVALRRPILSGPSPMAAATRHPTADGHDATAAAGKPAHVANFFRLPFFNMQIDGHSECWQIVVPGSSRDGQQSKIF
jgi:hypothetical protein